MQLFQITGAERDSGRDVAYIVEAPDEVGARNRAEAMGHLVSRLVEYANPLRPQQDFAYQLGRALQILGRALQTLPLPFCVVASAGLLAAAIYFRSSPPLASPALDRSSSAYAYPPIAVLPSGKVLMAGVSEKSTGGVDRYVPQWWLLNPATGKAAPVKDEELFRELYAVGAR